MFGGASDCIPCYWVVISDRININCIVIVGGYGVDEWGAEDQGFDGREFMKTLKSIQNIPVCRGCLKGGGASNCKIRVCAASKQLADCTECKEFMTCEHREALQKVRTGALNVGMLVKTDKDTGDQQHLIMQWIAEVKNSFPSCIVLSGPGSH